MDNTNFKGCFLNIYDRYGEPIYEGDILRYCSEVEFQVQWKEDKLAFMLFNIKELYWIFFDNYMPVQWEKIKKL